MNRVYKSMCVGTILLILFFVVYRLRSYSPIVESFIVSGNNTNQTTENTKQIQQLDWRLNQVTDSLISMSALFMKLNSESETNFQSDTGKNLFDDELLEESKKTIKFNMQQYLSNRTLPREGEEADDSPNPLSMRNADTIMFVFEKFMEDPEKRPTPDQDIDKILLVIR